MRSSLESGRPGGPTEIRQRSPASRHDRSEPRPLVLALGGLIALAAAMGIGRFIYTPMIVRHLAGAERSASACGFHPEVA